MTYQLLPVLASAGDVVFIVFVIVLAITSVIGKHLKNREEEGSENEPWTGGEGGGLSRQERLQELAARRREQLARLTGQQSGQPTNLAGSQHADRIRARTVYERRAEALRRAQAKASGQSQHTGTVSVERARAQAQARAKAQAQAREEAHVHAEAEVTAHSQEITRRRGEEQLKRQQRLDAISQREQDGQAVRDNARKQRDADLGSGARRAASGSTASQAGDVHRIVTDADSSAYDIRGVTKSRVAAALKSRALRDAIVFREILGSPRAVRPLEDLF